MKRIKDVLKNKIIAVSLSVMLVVLFAFLVMKVTSGASSNSVLIKTSEGDIVIMLNYKEAPVSVENFLSYVDSKFYDGLVFHRVIDGFMIQGGGFDETGVQKETNAPIKLESQNGLSNKKYSIAMARTTNPDSATSQFFINVENNVMLDYSPSSPGYAVFGEVIEGQNVVDKIKAIKTTTKNGMGDWPVDDVIIYSVRRV